MLRKIKVVFSILIIVGILSGCTNKNQINEMAYVVGLGIDIGEEKSLLVSLQLAKPMAVSGGSGGEEGEKGGKGGSTSLISCEAEDIFSAIAQIEGSLSKQINLSHTKLLIFSEEIAKNGVTDYVKTLMAASQFRPNTFAAVAKGKAKEYLTSVKPVLELNPAKYYTLVFSKSTKSFVPKATLCDLYFNINSKTRDSVMPLAGISYDEKENKTDIIGMAVLKDDKLVYTADKKSAEIYNILSGEYKEGYYLATGDDNENISVKLKMRRKPKITVNTKEKTPTAEINVKLTAELINNNSEKDFKTAEQIIEKCIKNEAEDFILKNKELSLDPLGYKKYSKKSFYDLKKWEIFAQNNNLTQISTNIRVNVTVKGDGLVQN